MQSSRLKDRCTRRTTKPVERSTSRIESPYPSIRTSSTVALGASSTMARVPCICFQEVSRAQVPWMSPPETQIRWVPPAWMAKESVPCQRACRTSSRVGSLWVWSS